MVKGKRRGCEEPLPLVPEHQERSIVDKRQRDTDVIQERLPIEFLKNNEPYCLTHIKSIYIWISEFMHMG